MLSLGISRAILYSRFGTLKRLEIDLNAHMLKSSCNKNITAQTGKEFHGAAGDTQVRHGSTENVCTETLLSLLFWSAEFGLGIT